MKVTVGTRYGYKEVILNIKILTLLFPFFRLFGFIDKKLISDTSAGKEQYRLNLDSKVVGSPFKCHCYYCNVLIKRQRFIV